MRKALLFLTVVLSVAVVYALPAHAATASTSVPDSGFSLQVTPSPLVTTVKPGQTTSLDLKVRNAGTAAENLKIEARSFRIDKEKVLLNDNDPPEAFSWISYSQPKFNVQPGQWATEQIRLAVPKEAGFSYSFALIISRQSDPKPTDGGRLIKGSLAVFTLVNVDRPGANRKLDIAQFTADRHVYEYLPSKLSIRLKNTGNTIVQPYGNIFIQRKSDSKTPLATLPVNENKGYILPNTARTLQASWSNGFPVYQTTTNEDGSTKKHLVWDWSKLSNIRIGHYKAELIAVYNDGQHDIPIRGELGFWVIPWKILIGLLIFTLLMLFGLWSLVRKIVSLVQRGKRQNHSTRR